MAAKKRRRVVVAVGDSSNWPLPDGELGWRMRYGEELSQSDRMRAASIMSAYSALIRVTTRRRAEIIRALRGAREESK